MVEPSDIPPQEVKAESTSLWHCGRRMKVSTSRVEGVCRVRFWRCERCGKTGKTVDFIPQGKAAGIMREERRH